VSRRYQKELSDLDQDTRIESIFTGWFFANAGSGAYNPKHRWFEVYEKIKKNSHSEQTRDRISVRNAWRYFLAHGLAPEGKPIEEFPCPGNTVPVLYYHGKYTKKDIIKHLKSQIPFPTHMLDYRNCWMVGLTLSRFGINMKTFHQIGGSWLSRFRQVNTEYFTANRPKRKKLQELISAGKVIAPQSYREEESESSSESEPDGGKVDDVAVSDSPQEEEEEDPLPPAPKKAKHHHHRPKPSATVTSATIASTSSAEPPVQAGESTNSPLEPIFYPSSDKPIEGKKYLIREILEWIRDPASTRLSKEDRKKVGKATMFDWFFIFDTILDKGKFETNKIPMTSVSYFLGRCHEVAPELELKFMIELANYGNHPQWEDPNQNNQIVYMETNEIFNEVYQQGIEFKCIDDERWELIPTQHRLIAESYDIKILFGFPYEYFLRHPELRQKLRVMMAPTNGYMMEMLSLCQNKEVVLSYGNLEQLENMKKMAYFCLDCLESFEWSPYLPKSHILVPTERCDHKVHFLLLKDYVLDLKIALQRGCRVISFGKDGQVRTVVPEWKDEEETKLMVSLQVDAYQEGLVDKGVTYSNLVSCKEFIVVKCPYCFEESAQQLTHHARLCSAARKLARTKLKPVADLYARIFGSPNPNLVRIFFAENPKSVIPHGIRVVPEEDHDGILIEAMSFEVRDGEIVPIRDLFAEKPKADGLEEFMKEVADQRPLSPLGDSTQMPPPDIHPPTPPLAKTPPSSPKRKLSPKGKPE